MEQRLIDANEIREFVLRQMRNDNIYCANDFLDVIDEQHTVDAVPVVRCKDCYLSMPAYTNGKMSETEIYCPFLDIRKPKDWHCGDGLRKRKEEDYD